MEQIYKYRSFAASIASGYKLFRTNVRAILVGSWIEAIAFSVIFGLCMAFTAMKINVLIIASVIALFVATVFWNGRVFVLIDGGKAADKLKRAFFALIAMFFFFALPLVGVPFLNVAMEIMLEEKPKTGRAFATGARHWGYLFLTGLISGLFMLAISLVICIPLYICIYGLIANHYGMMAGDPSGLPSAFHVILFFVGAFTSFIFLFTQLWQTYAFAYAHGAILTREKRRLENKKEEPTKGDIQALIETENKEESK